MQRDGRNSARNCIEFTEIEAYSPRPYIMNLVSGSK
ncbi:hypothetical protein SAMN05428973_10294 [Duganella sp. OV510]|nr:hypothetical protein SAMN05428973_10294 [Duganella sp. OV510]